MKRVFVISILFAVKISMSGQVVIDVKPEASNLCNELTLVSQGLERIQGILNEFTACNSNLKQASARSSKLSLSPTGNTRTMSGQTVVKEGGVQAVGTPEITKEIMEVKDEMHAINNRVVQLNDKLLAEEKMIQKSTGLIEMGFEKVKGKLTTASPEYRCISEQLTRINTIGGIIQKQEEKVFKEAEQVLGTLSMKTDCVQLLGDNCNLMPCLDCCDKQYPPNVYGNTPEQVAQSEFSRQLCRIKCNLEFSACILKKTTENTRDILGNMKP